MATRYDTTSKNVINNNVEQFNDILDERNVKSITHYNTLSLNFPTSQQIQSLSITKHTWKSNDRYWKLSKLYYGDEKYWWVIAWFNKKPIEVMVNVGDQVSVPLPLSDLLGFIK